MPRVSVSPSQRPLTLILRKLRLREMTTADQGGRRLPPHTPPGAFSNFRKHSGLSLTGGGEGVPLG